MGFYEGATAQADNAYLGGAKQAIAVPELGRIKHAAERIAKARSDIECFLGRFNGNSECYGGGAGDTDTCYRNDISSLFEQVERLEKVAAALNEIG